MSLIWERGHLQMAMLDVKDLNVYYGKIHAIKNISLTVEEGELVSLIGANGAGKTSLLTAIMGQIPSTGQISFEGQAVHGNGTMEIVRNGMTMVPEGRRVFPRTSVMDNLLLGAYSRKDKENVKGDLNKIFEMFPRLLERKNQLAGTLSGGEQQMLAVGRALMSRPDLVIAVDALAARNVHRLASTIQLTDTGIHPGSGVGNHRRGMTRENLGVPVIAIGVPTVVGAAAIVHGTVNALVRILTASKEGSRYGEYIRELDSDSQYELIRELLEPEFGAMFVTPQDMDERICKLSAAIAEGIRRAVERLEEER